MNTKAYWVGFNMVRGIGAVRLKALLEHFGSLDAAWQAPADELRSVGLKEKIIENFHKVRSQVDLEHIWEKIKAQGIQVITWEDEVYPRRLKEIDQPPPTLYVRGELSLEDEWAIAVVGTRRMTVYGRQVAEELSSFLASNHVTVVSGLARGVDAVAHQAALHADGRTIAVLGSGVDYIYPPEHRKLAEEICGHGALISEYIPGTQPESNNFPPRNRIISGLSMATVVIEAGETSGALITATFAVEQGREVFAVPGSILAPQSKGTNRLIREGARPMLNVEEVLEVLNLEQVQEYRQARLALPADEVEAKLLAVLQDEPLHVDEIQYRTGLPVDKVSAALVMMELKGMVRQAGAMTYQAVRETSGLYRTNK
jgi:DNA processing protein